MGRKVEGGVTALDIVGHAGIQLPMVLNKIEGEFAQGGLHLAVGPAVWAFLSSLVCQRPVLQLWSTGGSQQPYDHRHHPCTVTPTQSFHPIHHQLSFLPFGYVEVRSAR